MQFLKISFSFDVHSKIIALFIFVHDEDFEIRPKESKLTIGVSVVKQ